MRRSIAQLCLFAGLLGLGLPGRVLAQAGGQGAEASSGQDEAGASDGEERAGARGGEPGRAEAAAGGEASSDTTPGDADAEGGGAPPSSGPAADDGATGAPDEEAAAPPAGILVPRTVCHGRELRRVEVEGVRRVAPEDVRAVMGLRRGVPCSDDEVAEAARRLWDQGFFDDIVVLARPVGRRRVDLLVRLRERPAVGKIVFEGNDALSDEDLDEEVRLRLGRILSLGDVREDVERIRKAYVEEGYFLAKVDYEVRPYRPARGEVAVVFRIEEGEEVVVRRVRFVGNHHVSGDELRSVMATGETGALSFLTSRDKFDRKNFEDDLVRLQAFYYDKGYLAIRVRRPLVELSPDRRYVDVTIPVEEGPRFRISSLRVREVGEDGQEIEPLGGAEALRKLVPAKAGDWFSRTQVLLGIQAITRHYRDAGYARAEIVPETHIDEAKREVAVAVTIRRGPLVRIERIEIAGNEQTRDEVIRRELVILEGELYSQTKVELSRARVEALGYFEKVEVSEEDGSGPDTMVLHFEVIEKSTGTFQLGAGLSSIEQFLLTAQIQHDNLFGNGQALALQLQLSAIRQLAILRFREPYLYGSRWSLSVEGFKTIRQYLDFQRDSTGGGFTLGHPLGDDRLRLFGQYRLEYVDIAARTGGFFGAGGSGLTSLPSISLFNLFRDGITSSVRLALTWDSRNNRLFPSKGIYASLSTEVADSVIGSQNIFVRNEAFFRFFHRIWGPFVLRLNVEGGLITSRDSEGVPVFERYFLGGIYTVRGFDLNGLGPRAGLPSGTDPNGVVRAEGVPIGGNLQLYYNLEVEFPIIEAVGIRGVVFTDGGNAWNLEDTLCQAPLPELVDPAADPCGVHPNLRFSWGFGLRWFSPMGPLRFEWGIPFARRSYERDILFEFTIGNFF